MRDAVEPDEAAHPSGRSRRLSWRPRLCGGVITAMILAGAKTNGAPLGCSSSHPYDATEKASIAALLKTNYGDAYKAFDLDHPSSFDVGGRKLSSLVIGRSSWLAFSRGGGDEAPSKDVPTRIVVGFDACSGRVVALQVIG